MYAVETLEEELCRWCRPGVTGVAGIRGRRNVAVSIVIGNSSHPGMGFFDLVVAATDVIGVKEVEQHMARSCQMVIIVASRP